jgi:lipopolysaccharide/colanic/teichoic acid biosynthesis glycosyltransferase
VKRSVDLAGAAALLLLTGPLLLVLAGAVLATLGRPILFRQARTGLGGRVFTLLKLRTMRPVRPGDSRDSDAARLGAFGRWLRATSLDELPQLWNVLRGDMSLVGPRPLLPEYLGRYTPEQARRHAVRPGLTGLAQVHGRNALTWEEKFALDLRYVDEQSLALDLRILWRTAACVLGRRDVAAAGHATMPEFLGVAGREHTG